jgi:hypothetical protein
MTIPKESDPFKELAEINKEILTFNFNASESEQKKEVQRLANKVKDMYQNSNLGTVVELSGDAVSIFSCAIKPADIVACLFAIVAVIDVIKAAKEKKLD